MEDWDTFINIYMQKLEAYEKFRESSKTSSELLISECSAILHNHAIKLAESKEKLKKLKADFGHF